MKGRWIAWGLAAALALALAGQTLRWRERLLASRLLRQAEVVSLAVAAGRAPRHFLAGNLEVLRHAAALDPSEVGIPIARGSQHYLLGNPEAAIESYRQALALEPRAEIYLNLGRAEAMAGRTAEARRDFGTALRLDPNFAGEVPEDLR